MICILLLSVHNNQFLWVSTVYGNIYTHFLCSCIYEVAKHSVLLNDLCPPPSCIHTYVLFYSIHVVAAVDFTVRNA